MLHPYQSLPPHTRWSKSISGLAVSDVDPVVNFPFKISKADRVATAGSCFAQHIARRLSTSGYNYYVVEDGHPLADDKLCRLYNYGVYSARYANIYTTRQLTQLMRRAYGELKPVDAYWKTDADRYLDPLRPTIQPNGFATLRELNEDTKRHLSKVRMMFESLDYFVFTLGLTETWLDKRDGIIYPVCPGVAGGTFDANIHEFKNFEVHEVIGDLEYFINRLLSVNKNAKVILTVSPVPLAATARQDSHVLTSTTYSKSVLRVAAEKLSKSFENVAYFPSYEIITGSFNRGAYYSNDLRSVLEPGVDHVMKLFFKHATLEETAERINDSSSVTPPKDEYIARMQQIVQTLCEEELLDK